MLQPGNCEAVSEHQDDFIFSSLSSCDVLMHRLNWSRSKIFTHVTINAMHCNPMQCNGMTVKEKSLCFEYLISRNLHLTLYEIFSANIHFPIPIQNGEKWCSKVSSAIWHPESAIRNLEVSQIYFYLLWNHKTQPATLDTFYSHHHYVLYKTITT